MKREQIDRVCEELMTQIDSVYDGVLGGVLRSDDQARLKAFWEIGRVISVTENMKELPETSRSAVLGQLGRLASKKYGKAFCRTNMYHMRRFYATYPTMAVRPALSWTHYRTLISVEDETKRNELETQAELEHLSHRALEKLVKQTMGFRKTATPRLESRLATEERTLNVYEIVSGVNGELLLDVGLGVRTPLLPGELAQPRSHRLLSLHGHGTELAPVEDGSVRRFAYEASVVRVVDGDTLILEIQLHPRVTVRQHVRLRGIRVLDVKSSLGEKATRFVRRRLKPGRRLVVHTYDMDRFGRYTVDVFYRKEGDRLPDDRDGIYLNRELVVAGLAELA